MAQRFNPCHPLNPWLRLRPHPPHRLLRQLVERGHAEFEVFFLRVLDFVVADAVQALDNIITVGTPARATSAASCVGSCCRSRTFCGKRPKIIPDFQVHSVNLGQKTCDGHFVILSVLLYLPNLRYLSLELADALLRDFQFVVVLNHNVASTMPRLLPSRLICQWAMVASSPPSAAARRIQNTLAPRRFCAAA